ncbi:hypothetical protein [Amphritea sp. HPY]|uniref:hypothetical protein n=1 Tax=Amphritea sp. HPY TaxID=3421652 RepID=UPI003D7C417E
MILYDFSSPLTDNARNRLLFQGDLVVFRQIPAMLQLSYRLDQIISHHLKQAIPPQATLQMTCEQFHNRISMLQSAFTSTSEFRQLCTQALQQAGMAIDNAFADALFLRTVPPEKLSNKAHNNKFRGSIAHHRDTWGSNIQPQINWWSPIYKITEQRGIAFYPDYWDKAITNTTASWSFEEFLKSRDRTPSGQPVSYPFAPQACEPVDEGKQVRITIEPGDLLCFSSAHLHASVANTTQLTRFSLEMRTVSITDLLQGHQPPNIDNHADIPMYHWFRRMTDRQLLSEAVADSLAINKK